jgi:hypothetical protein
LKSTTRFVVPFGAHVGGTATEVSGSVEGTGNVEAVVELVLVLDVVVDVAAFFFDPPLTWINTTMRMMATAMAPNVAPRRIVVRRLRCFWMMDCFSARIAR